MSGRYTYSYISGCTYVTIFIRLELNDLEVTYLRDVTPERLITIVDTHVINFTSPGNVDNTFSSPNGVVNISLK